MTKQTLILNKVVIYFYIIKKKFFISHGLRCTWIWRSFDKMPIEYNNVEAGEHEVSNG